MTGAFAYDQTDSFGRVSKDLNGERLEELRKVIALPITTRAESLRAIEALTLLNNAPETPIDLWREVLAFSRNVNGVARDHVAIVIGATKTAACLLLKSPNGVSDFVSGLVADSRASSAISAEIEGGVEVLSELLSSWKGRNALAEMRSQLEVLKVRYPEKVSYILDSVRGADRSEAYRKLHGIIQARLDSNDGLVHRETEEALAGIIYATKDLSGADPSDIRFLISDPRGGWPIAVLKGLLSCSREQLKVLEPDLKAMEQGPYKDLRGVKKLLKDLNTALI